MLRSGDSPPEIRRTDLLARDLLDRVGDRWSALVIFVLRQEPLRFTELREQINAWGPRRLRQTEISHKMLAGALKRLIADGLVLRVETPGPARYALTPLGHSFWTPMMAVHAWTAQHIDELEAARRRAPCLPE
jgi:DNA-binding HxlR family transcriptional regulator